MRVPRIVTALAAITTVSMSSTAFALDRWQWYFDTNRNGTTETTQQFGLTTDAFVQGDFDGDSAMDVAVVRVDAADDLQWFLDVGTGLDPVFGNEGDRPVPADYDGDGAADLAVVRKGADNWTWFVDTDMDEDTDMSAIYGWDTDRPVPADYNGDGATDFAVTRETNGQLWWYVNTDHDSDTEHFKRFGIAGDVPVPADYDGDGEADYAVARKTAGTWVWYVDHNRDGITDVSETFGHSTDLLRPADYNGDGATDFVALRREDAHWHWYFDTDLDGISEDDEVYGLSSDYPFPADYTGGGWADLVVIRRDWSENIYRIPFEDDVGVSVSNDVVGHSPLGRIDMGCDISGCMVVAAAGGWVEAVVDQNTQGSCDDCPNNYIWISHPNGEWTKYSHIAYDTAEVVEGEWVDVGDELGVEGNVGTQNVHLHFEVAVPLDGTNKDTALNDAGFVIGANRVPAICDIEGGTFVEHEEYLAAPCE